MQMQIIVASKIDLASGIIYLYYPPKNCRNDVGTI